VTVTHIQPENHGYVTEVMLEQLDWVLALIRVYDECLRVNGAFYRGGQVFPGYGNQPYRLAGPRPNRGWTVDGMMIRYRDGAPYLAVNPRGTFVISVFARSRIRIHEFQSRVRCKPIQGEEGPGRLEAVEMIDETKLPDVVRADRRADPIPHVTVLQQKLWRTRVLNLQVSRPVVRKPTGPVTSASASVAPVPMTQKMVVPSPTMFDPHRAARQAG